MFPTTSGLREKMGLIAGTALSPLFLVGSALRDARFFHPRGLCFHAVVEPARAVQPGFETLASRLSGDALVRLSSALWREERNLPNLLGLSIRFKAQPPLEKPTVVSQDLLTATARSPWTLAVDSVRTNQHDFLANRYYGMSPFEVDGLGSIQIRITPKPTTSMGEDRYQKLAYAVGTSEVRLLMEVLDRRTSSEWQPVVEIRLEKEVDIDESKLQFWPFRNGLGIKPKGFVHFLRPMPYVASRFGRNKLNRGNGKETSTAGELPAVPVNIKAEKAPAKSSAKPSKAQRKQEAAKALTDSEQ